MQFSIVKFICLNIAFYNVQVFACVGELTIETRAGKVRGAKQTGSEGEEFCSFKGIPYAKPPVGDLRFKDPEPAETWTDVRETTSHGPNCAQFNIFLNQMSSEEDCLYLNVYTKSTEQTKKRPVMVWIHGGAFVCFSGDDSVFGPDYFMRKDIVLVTINYRLGIFGFLNLDDESAAGNQGLKDQLLALQWVRDNIAKFGGDPENVTIFGESAGGASVHYLTISPLSKGLFHKAIAQSGVALNPWAFHSNAKERALQLCNILGHTDTNVKSALQFLKTAEAQKIVKAHKQILTKEEKIQGQFSFGPSIDSASKNPLIPVHPKEAAVAGIQVPLIIGHTNREGLIFIRNVNNAYDRFNKEFDDLVHPYVKYTIQQYGLSLEDLKQFYFGNGTVTKDNLDKLIDLIGDLYIVRGVHEVVKNQVEKSSSPTYFYEFTYDKGKSFMKIMFNTQMSGASHADELYYLFRINFLNGRMPFPEKGSDRYKITEQMIELWVNFATTGVPTPQQSELVPFNWQRVENGTIFPSLNICENLRMEEMINLEQRYRSRQMISNHS